MAAYAEAFDAGHAHSFEVWNADGDLVGGGYGLAFGRMFSTESQFSFEPNTSKIGFTVLNWHLAHWGFVLNDGQALVWGDFCQGAGSGILSRCLFEGRP